VVDIEILKSLGTAVTSIKAISDLAATITNVQLRQELNGKIADLQGVVIAVRQQMLEIQEKYERLLEERKELKEIIAPRQKPQMQWGCYRFEGENGLFCTACYDTKGKKIQTTRLNINFRQCPVCKASFGAG